MASLENNIMGILRGRIGNIVARKFNNKQVVSIRPHKYKTSNTREAWAERNKFSSVVAFTKCINSIPDLNAIWNQSGIEGFSAYHKIIKTNLLLTSGSRLGNMNIIVPPSPNLLGVNCIFQSKNIECELAQFQNINRENISDYYTFRFVFVFSEPFIDTDAVNKIIGYSYSFSKQELTFDSKINIGLSEEIMTSTLNYAKCIMYSTVFRHNVITNKYQWTSTLAQVLH